MKTKTYTLSPHRCDSDTINAEAYTRLRTREIIPYLFSPCRCSVDFTFAAPLARHGERSAPESWIPFPFFFIITYSVFLFTRTPCHLTSLPNPCPSAHSSLLPNPTQSKTLAQNVTWPTAVCFSRPPAQNTQGCRVGNDNGSGQQRASGRKMLGKGYLRPLDRYVRMLR